MPTTSAADRSAKSSDKTRTQASRARDLAAFRRVMQFFALSTVLAGAVIGLLPLGLEAAEARRVSTVLLIVGISDCLVLRFWRRLF